jgi:hypothetical protein
VPGIEARADIALLETEAGIMGEMGKVLRVARAQIVDANHGVALAEHAIGEMRAKESSGAGYKCTLGQTQFSKSKIR